MDYQVEDPDGLFTFGYEAFAMAHDGEQLRAALYVGLHLVLGLTFVWIAYSLASSR